MNTIYISYKGYLHHRECHSARVAYVQPYEHSDA